MEDIAEEEPAVSEIRNKQPQNLLLEGQEHGHGGARRWTGHFLDQAYIVFALQV